MKAVYAEFVRPPDVSLLFRVAVAAMAAITVGLVIVGFQVRAQTDRLQAEAVAQLMLAREEAAQAARTTVATTPPPPYVADARAALRQQEFPLNAVLTALETVAVVGVRVTSVDIQTGDGAVRVQVEFSDYEALLKYLNELNAGEPTERWSLVNAQNNGAAATGRPSAILTSAWTADGVPSRR